MVAIGTTVQCYIVYKLSTKVPTYKLAIKSMNAFPFMADLNLTLPYYGPEASGVRGQFTAPVVKERHLLID